MVELIAIQYHGRTGNGDTAIVTLKNNGKEITEIARSDSGPVEAIYSAINKGIGRNFELLVYSMQSQGRGSDAFGLVRVTVAYNNETAVGQASDKNILEASALAYITAINQIGLEREKAPDISQIPQNLKEFENLRKVAPFPTK